MGKNRANIIINIIGEAQSLQKTIQEAQQNLSKLHLNPKIYEDMKRATETMLKDLKKSTDAGQLGLFSQTQLDNERKRVLRIGQDFSTMISRIKGMDIKVEDFLPETKEYRDKLKEYEKAQKDYEDKISKIKSKDITLKGHGKYVENINKAARKDDGTAVSSISSLKNVELTKIYKDSRGVYNQLKSLATEAGISVEKMIEQIKEEFEEYSSKSTPQEKAAFTKSHGGKAKNYDIVARNKLATSYEQYLSERKDITSVANLFTGEAVDLEKYRNAVNSLNLELNEMAEPVQEAVRNALEELYASELKVKGATEGIGNEFDEAGVKLKQFNEKTQQIQQLKSYFTQFFSATAIFMRLGQTVKGALNDFKELDKQFNEISIVTGKTMDELWKGFANLNYIAQQYGVVTSDVVSTQKLYYQQGRSATEVTQLTGKTLTLARISGLDFAKATEYMTAAINAYKIEASEANRVTDTYSALSTEAAVDANEVAVAMSKVASLAAMSGSEFESTSAYLAKIIETTREAPETAGTALKTVIARFTAVNKLTQDQKELLDDDYNFNNIEKALKSIGVSVKDSTGQMRSFTAILNDLGPIWDDLDSNTQHYIATQAAGARQQSRFIALMDDWGRTQELINVAETSAGTGAKQLALAMDSIETKTNKLEASWQEFYTKFLSSDMFKDLLDAANGLLKVLIEISEIPVIGPPLIAGIAASMIILTKLAFEWGEEFARSFVSGEWQEKRKARKAQRAKEKAENIKNATIDGATEETAKQEAKEKTEDVYEAKERAEDTAKNAEKGFNDGTTYQEFFEAGQSAANNPLNPPIQGDNLSGKGKLKDLVANSNFGKWNKGFFAGDGSGGGLVGGFKQGFGQVKSGWQSGKGLSKVGGALKGAKAAGTTAKIAGGASKTALAFGATAAGGAGAGAAVGSAVAAAIPYVAIAAAIIAVAVGVSKLVEAWRAREEKKILEKVAKSQTKIDASIKKISDTSNAYADALELQSKGLTRTTEEMEKYQESLTTLKDIYPNLVTTLSDGTLELASNAQYLYADLMEQERQKIKTEYDNIENMIKSTKAAASSGVVFSEEGRNIQQSISEATAGLTEKDDEYLHDVLGLKGLNVEHLTELQEKGLTRTSLNAAVNKDGWGWENDLNQQEYLNMLQKFASGEKGTGGLKQEYELIEYYASQMGMSVEEMCDQLIKEADGTAARVAEGSSLAASYAAQAATSVSTYINFAVEKIAEDEDRGVEEVEAEAKTYYLGNTEENRVRFESYLDSMASELTLDKISKTTAGQFSIVGAENLVQEAIELQKQSVMDMLTGETGIFEAYRQIIQNNLSDETLLEHFKDKTISQTTNLIEQMKKVGQSGGAMAAREFEKAYNDYQDSIKYSETLLSQFTNVDTTNIADTAKYAAEMAVKFGEDSQEYKGFVDLVNKTSHVLDRTFRSYNDIISDTKNEIEGFSDSLSNLGEGLTGSLDAEGLLELLSEFQGILTTEDFIATSEGFKFANVENEKEALELAEQLLDIKRLELEYEKQINTLKLNALQVEVATKTELSIPEQQQYLQLQQKILSKQELSTQEKQDYIKLQNHINSLTDSEAIALIEQQLSLVQSNSLLEQMNIVWEQIYIQSIKANHPIKKQIEELEKLLDLLAKIEEYADIDAYIENLELKLSHYDFELEFSTNIDNIVNTTEDKLNTLNNLINASISKSQRATANAAVYRADLEATASQAVSFDKSGNLLTNDEWFRSEARRISAIDDDEVRENEEAILEVLYDKIDAYREEHKLIQQASNEAESYLKQVEEVVTTLRENVTELEDKFLELFIQRDEEALESLEERYEAMKEADQDYLDSVREAIDEERKLRDQNKAYDDVEKMERQLELLRMSGGSATQIQELEQQIADARQDINDTEIDNRLDSIEKEANKRAENYDEEVEYQQAVLEAKKENQIAYNVEIAALMKQDKETIMNTWKTLDEEYKVATIQNKILLEQNMNDLVTNGIASLKSLEKDGIQIVENAYKKVETAIDLDTTAMITYANAVSSQSNAAVLSLHVLSEEYYNVRDSIQAALDVQNDLNDAIDEYNGLNVQLPEAETEERSEVLPENFETWEAYYKYLEQHPEKENGFTQGVTQDQPTFARIQEKFKDSSGKTWYKANGYWYQQSEIIADNGSSITIKSNASSANIDDVNKAILSTINFTADTESIWDRDADDESAVKAGTYLQYKEGISSVEKNDLEKMQVRVRGASKWITPGVAPSVYDGSKFGYGSWVMSSEGGKVNVRTGAGDTYKIPEDIFFKYYTIGQFKKYATGGLVDFTGPAWVDGSPTKPEAFLSAKDTTLIAGLRDVLRANYSFGTPVTATQKTGDVYYEIHINVDELGEGYSVDDLVDEMEERILQATGNNTVIKVK